jgi:2-succinyl-5-enolpyruvyl-6-hydroxy-3-cyclohexene-1-carboxylate synthase
MTTPATLDFRNTNSLWASVLVETLVRAGIHHAVISPGSRSTPLTIAFARHPGVRTTPVLDERSAGFFALGMAKATMQPVVLVCTSGTAAANYFPAVVEAAESAVPLLLITADRPPELRACASGQTIDQQKLYGGYVQFFHEFAVPELDASRLRYLRQMSLHAVARTLAPNAGPVHLNAPFRDPLPPVADGGAAQGFGQGLDWARFFAEVGCGMGVMRGGDVMGGTGVSPVIQGMGETPMRQPGQDARATAQPGQGGSATWHGSPDPWVCSSPSHHGSGEPCHINPDAHGLIVVGPNQPANVDRFIEELAGLARRLGWPVLADGLAPVRNHASRVPNIVTTYDTVLRNANAAERLKPERVICVGGWPTSKVLRAWLENTDAPTWLISSRPDNRDALHGRTSQVGGGIGALGAALTAATGAGGYARMWQRYEERARSALDQRLSAAAEMVEPKVAWLLAQHLPADTPLFIANSMPIRDVEYVWPAGDRRVRALCNRGANGIDGTLSTAIGVAAATRQRTVLLTGDLALLHDTNGFLLRARAEAALTIVLINNRGGGIFEHLPVAQFDPPFEEFFATPQDADFARLCGAYGVEHVAVRDWTHFAELIAALPGSGLRVLEVRTDRKRDAALRRQWFAEIAGMLE